MQLEITLETCCHIPGGRPSQPARVRELAFPGQGDSNGWVHSCANIFADSIIALGVVLNDAISLPISFVTLYWTLTSSSLGSVLQAPAAGGVDRGSLKTCRSSLRFPLFRFFSALLQPLKFYFLSLFLKFLLFILEHFYLFKFVLVSISFVLVAHWKSNDRSSKRPWSSASWRSAKCSARMREEEFNFLRVNRE